MSAKQKGGNTVSMARKLAEPYAKELGLQLWDVLFLKEGASWILRFIIDREEGVGIEDCEALSRAIDGPLDEADFIEQSYFLEVSSPGLGRELKKPHHFAAMQGREVIVHLVRPRDGQRDFIGSLIGLVEHDVVIEDDTGESLHFPKSEIAWVKLNDEITGDDPDFEYGGSMENE